LLVYFKKGYEEWGTPFDTTTWRIPSTFGVDSSDNKLWIFPNPARERITVVTPGKSIEELKLVLYSMAGTKVREYYLKPGEQSISLSDYRAGMYYAKLYQNSKLIGYQKIVRF
jgi:hypothetical protein